MFNNFVAIKSSVFVRVKDSCAYWNTPLGLNSSSPIWYEHKDFMWKLFLAVLGYVDVFLCTFLAVCQRWRCRCSCVPAHFSPRICCRKATKNNYLIKLEINHVEKENSENLDESDGFAKFSAGSVCYSLKTDAGLRIFVNCRRKQIYTSFFSKTGKDVGVWFDHTEKSSIRFPVDSPNWEVWGDGSTAATNT